MLPISTYKQPETPEHNPTTHHPAQCGAPKELDPKPNSQLLCVEPEPKLKVLHKKKELPNIGLN